MYNIITDNDIKSIVEKPYTLVCGLWHKGCAYIDSVVQQNIIVLEKNPHNPNIAKYQDKGIMVLVGDAKALISQLPFDNLQSIVIVASNDMDNIEIALAFQEALRVQNITAKKLYVHIENHSLQHLYLNDLLHPNNVYANVFSVAKKSVELFFRKNALTGENRNYMESNQPFGVAIVGNTQLASEMIGHIATIANLPNENQITLYCIDKDIESFKNTVQLRFQEIDQISTIRLEYLSLDYQSQAFYTHQVWKENLTHIILCDEAKINLQIATRLLQTSYLIKTIDRKLKTPIHVATYEYDHLSDKLKDHDY
ncbi:MAG: NAD-binding protein, partial [Campylobacterota bacterium]|nr:NAD-binding protein [Campylobacterota bacterium]